MGEKSVRCNNRIEDTGEGCAAACVFSAMAVKIAVPIP